MCLGNSRYPKYNVKVESNVFYLYRTNQEIVQAYK